MKDSRKKDFYSVGGKIKNAVKSFFTVNIGLKLLALAFSLCLWVFINYPF